MRIGGGRFGKKLLLSEIRNQKKGEHDGYDKRDCAAAYTAVRQRIRNRYKHIVHYPAPMTLGIGRLRK